MICSKKECDICGLRYKDIEKHRSENLSKPIRNKKSINKVMSEDTFNFLCELKWIEIEKCWYVPEVPKDGLIDLSD